MKVLITGGYGNIGVTMARYLLDNTNAEVVVSHRRRNIEFPGKFSDTRLSHQTLDITDETNLREVVLAIRPDYFINLAGFTQPEPSWQSPGAVYGVNCIGVMKCLESIRNLPACSFFSAGTIEEYAGSSSPINEDSAPCPLNPYGASKAAAHQIVRIYREKYNLRAVHGILGNNESGFKSQNFVFPKIIASVANFARAFRSGGELPAPVLLGNIHARRSWGDTVEFCDAIWKMLNQPGILLGGKGTPKRESTIRQCDITVDEALRDLRHPVQVGETHERKDYVVATDEFHTIQELFDLACYFAGIKNEWLGNRGEEISIANGFQIAEVSPRFFREEPPRVRADASLIKKELGWEPKTTLAELVKRLITVELNKD